MLDVRVDNVPATEAPASEPGLMRSMNAFSSCAISMSTICILAGGITSFHVGFCSVGGTAIGIGWPLEMLFALAVALTMGQVASAFPTAGGTYHWAYTLGGRGWGWTTACFSLAGLITALAAVNVGLCDFIVNAFSDYLHYQPRELNPRVRDAMLILMTTSQAFINQRGIRFTTKLNDFNGYLIIIVGLALTAAMIIFGVILKTGFEPERLFTFHNFSGLPKDDSVWPATDNVYWLFALGLLLPAYTLTGFDASAQTSEETLRAAHAVPRGIVRAVLISGLAGWVVLSAVVLAVPDMEQAANEGDRCFHWIVSQVVPSWLLLPLLVGVCFAQYLCGLAVVTSASRMAFAFARDGGMPLSRYVRRVCPVKRTPDVAIWTVAGLTILFGIAIAYTTVAAICAIFVYLSYVVPTTLGLLAHGRTWTRMGPWHIGRWYRPLAGLCVLGCTGLIVIGVQPPNDIARPVVGGTIVLLACLWFGYKRYRFPGPPPAVLLQLQPMEVEGRH